MYSIYHFFADLYRKRRCFKSVDKLGAFPFDTELLSCVNKNTFPDLAIRINPGGNPPGGELIELKDSKTSYGIASFNSTIPRGRKAIADITSGKTNVVRERMQEAEEDIYSLPDRDVFYLLRGRKADNTKVCLVHGSFFETIPVEKLIKGSFDQVIADGLEEGDGQNDENVRELLDGIVPRQSHFSKSRHVKDASVTLRFRVMTEAAKESNILNPQLYPTISDNTLSLVTPAKTSDCTEATKQFLRQALSKSEWAQSEKFTITHPFNGDFFVLSYAL